MPIPIPNIRNLTAFAATVKHGTVTAAADNIALTQPALTRAISRLEKELDCRLFDREPGGMRPTEPALLLAERAERGLTLIGSPRVTATQVRAFLALARKGSYTEAANHLGLAPASLHRAIADLSVALGERLIERRGRHLSLTRKGEQRARSFGLALAEFRSGLAEVSEWLGKAGGRVAMGAMPLSRARWLPEAIIAFKALRPDVELVVVEGSHAELTGPLRDGEIDFLLGALRDDGDFSDLSQERAFADRPQIAMRSGHPLAMADSLSRTALCAYPWAVSGAGTPLRNYWNQMFVDLGTAPEIAIECGSVLTIRELLLATDMLTLLSPDQLRVEIEAGLLTCLPPPIVIERTIGITTRRDWQPTPAQRLMLDILRDKSKGFS